MNCAADECGWKELKIVRIKPNFLKYLDCAEVLEAIINDDPDSRRDLQRALDEAAKAEVDKLVMGTGFFRVEGLEAK